MPMNSTLKTISAIALSILSVSCSEDNGKSSDYPVKCREARSQSIQNNTLYLKTLVKFDPQWRTFTNTPFRCPNLLISFSSGNPYNQAQKIWQRSVDESKILSVEVSGYGILSWNDDVNAPEFTYRRLDGFRPL
jgi:hypothetical protein